MKKKLTLFSLVAGTLLTMPPEVRGDTHFWNGGSTIGSYWSDAANWGNSTPSTSDEWVFGSLARARSTNDYGSFTFFRTISIRTNGIYLTGQPLMVRYLNMDCSSGTSTVDMDLRPLDTYPGGLSISNSHGGATLVLSGNLAVPDRSIDVHCGGTVTLSGAITGTNHMSEDGGGRLRFTGSQANSFAGEMNVQLGVLELNKTLFYPPLGFTLGITSMPCDLRIGKWGSPYISAIAALYFHNQIADTADVTVNQTGQLDLNDYDDTIGALNMLGGSVITRDGTLTLGGDLSASSVTNCRVAGNLDLGSPLTRYICVTNPADLQLTANVSGPAIQTLRKIGNGELVLGGSNSYGGPTIIVEGQVTLTSDNGLGDAARGTTLRDGTRLCLDGVVVADESLLVDDSAAMEVVADSVWFGPVQVDSNLVVSAPASHRLTINGTVSGAGGFITTNRGTFRLTGTTANSLSGTCRVDAGTVELAKVAGPAIAGTLIIGDGVGGLESDIVQHFMTGQFAPEARVVIGTSGLLSLNGADAVLGWLSGTGAVALGTSSLILTNQAPHEFSGSIRGSGGVAKGGDSIWTLRGTSSYTGNTTVREGTLIMNGTVTASPQVEVMSGATLGGVGHVQGVTLHAGATLNPGTQIGSLYIHGPVSLIGGRLEIELGELAGNPESDQIITSQRPDLTGCVLAVYPTVVPALGDSWVIVDNLSTEPLMGTFTGLPEGAYVVGSGLVFQISYLGGTGNDVSLRRVPAPASTLEKPYFTSSGGFLLRGQGVPGATYEVQASTNLLPGSWVFLQNLVASPSGSFYFQDVNASDYPRRFYRVRSP